MIKLLKPDHRIFSRQFRVEDLKEEQKEVRYLSNSDGFFSDQPHLRPNQMRGRNTGAMYLLKQNKIQKLLQMKKKLEQRIVLEKDLV